MTAVSVTTDLTTLAVANTTADSPGVWGESTNATWDDGGAPINETDFYIQGNACQSAQFTKTGIGTILYDHGTAFSFPTDGAILMWHFWASPPSLQNTANVAPGVGFCLGSSVADFRVWPASGNDFRPNPIGGWYCYALNPNTAVAVANTVGTPGTYDTVGAAINATAQARGQPFAVDAIRIGRCDSRVTGGGSPDANATFADIANTLDTANNRYGIFQSVAGGYSWQGRLQFGTTTAAVNFTDQNKNIFIINTPLVTPEFNKIEVANNSSRVVLTGCTFLNTGNPATPLGTSPFTTQSRGGFEVVSNNANVNLIECRFADMGNFIFGANSVITGTQFNRCGQITSNDAIFTDCSFSATVANVQLVITNLNEISTCDFIGDNTSHAINLGTISANTTMSWDSTYDSTTYATSNVASSGSSTGGESEVLLVNVASGATLTINVTAGDAPTYRNTGTGTVNVQQTITFTITNLIDQSEVRIVNSGTGTIIAGVESVGTSPSGLDNVTVSSDPNAAGRFRVQYGYSYTGDINANIVVMNYNYQHYSQAVVLGNSNGSLLVSQVIDRNYSNP